MTDYVGQQFGDYQLLRWIAGGGFADVYEAEQVHLGTKAAVKLLKERLTKLEKEAFRREARTVVKLEHPHIVRIYTFSIQRDTPYIAMSYAPGSLDMLHPKGTILPLATVVSYVKQIAEALQYAHAQKVVHRDIKPANFLMGKDGQILLADFGIAVIAQQTASWKEQQVAGTYLYMAPEQFQAKAEPASDQYALGIVVYQWLCGESPFTGNAHALLYHHLHTLPPPLHEKISVSPTVETIVLKALAKSPQERFSSVQDFAKALEQASLIVPPSAVPKTKVQWRNEGFAHYNAGHYEKAIAAYDRAIQLDVDHDYALAYYNRGLAYHALGEYRKAISDYDQALRIEPNLALAERKRKEAYEMHDRK